MRTYLLNSPILTAYGTWTFQAITDEEAKGIARHSETLISAIGHESSARLLSHLLDLKVHVCRQTIRMRPGDRAIILRVTERMPEGAVLDDAALAAWPKELGLLELGLLERLT